MTLIFSKVKCLESVETEKTPQRHVIERVIKVCSKVIGERQRSLSQLYQCRVVRKAGVISRDTSHVLAKHYELLPSGRRYRVPKMKTVRARTTFIPNSIMILNKT